MFVPFVMVCSLAILVIVFAGGGDNYSNSQSTKHQGSNLKVTGNLNISADNINIQGSKVVANNATIKSDNLNIAAVQDSKATACF
jgi:hypothetical protein